MADNHKSYVRDEVRACAYALSEEVEKLRKQAPVIGGDGKGELALVISSRVLAEIAGVLLQMGHGHTLGQVGVIRNLGRGI